jgi:branched-chain amino acid transport system substrate-binding protein
LGVPWKKAADVWAKWINDKGGILGHPVVLLNVDTQSDPASTTSVLNSLFANPKVIAVVHGGDDCLGCFDAVAKAPVPVISGIYDDPVATKNPNVFPVGAAKDMVRVEALVRLGIGRSPNGQALNGAYLYAPGSNHDPDQSFRIAPLRAAARKAGGELVYSEQIPESPPADFDFLSRCRAAQEKNVGWVFFMIYPQALIHFAESCATIGYKPTWVNEYFANSFRTVSSLDGMKVVLSNPQFDGDNPAVEEFRRIVARYNPDWLKQPDFTEPAIVAWASLQLVAKAIETAHPQGSEITRADIYRGLYSLKGETLGGLAPPLTFHRGRPTDVRCYFMAEIKEGKLVPTSPKPIC